jgi:hypothetical protein
VYAAWVLATYLLEGLPRTLLRPEATGLRIAYALVANLALGILLPLAMIRAFVRNEGRSPESFGLAAPPRIAVGVAAGCVAGFALFALSGASPVDALVGVNAFCQAWVVSLAEVLVCWGLVGTAVYLSLQERNRVGAYLAGAASASVLFGFYHYAHSPPFNEIRMVLFLTGIGVVTSLWWFASRELYGTAVFHNFFAVTGVLQALGAQGLLAAHAHLTLAPLVTAAAATLAVASLAIHIRTLARREPRMP